MANYTPSFFGERAGEYVKDLYDTPPSFAPTLLEKTFNEHYEELANRYQEQNGIDIKRDIGAMVADKSFMETFKNDLLTPIADKFRDLCPNDNHILSIIENVDRLWDAKVRNYSESASTIAFLPISTLEFPVLAKQFWASITKDIIEVEAVKTPNIMKHVKTTYLVDNLTGEEYEYPKCLWNGEWEKAYKAARGFEINPLGGTTNNQVAADKHIVTTLPAYKYDVVSELTDGVPGVDKLSYNIKIMAVAVGDEIVPLKGNGITVEFSTGGTLVNGEFIGEKALELADGTKIEDVISGQVDFKNGTVSISSAAGKITGVIITGYLSNELNLRTISVRERRDLMKFVVEDGPRWSMPFSIEEIEDHAALLDINYYNRMVDEMVKTMDMIEGSTVIKFLDDEFDRFNGVPTDIYKLESIVQTQEVDLRAPAGFAGDPFKYKANAVQFALKGMIYKLQESAKLDNLSFVIAGNPMACQLLSEWTTWKYQQGTTTGGIQMNNSYGFMTDMSAPVRVVASNRYAPYTDEKVGTTGVREMVLRIYAYPTDPEHITFKHLKYTNHLMTSQSQTAYQNTRAPGGAFTVITATSRFKDMSILGIQARLILLNSADVYGALA